MQDQFDLTAYVTASTHASGVPLKVEDQSVITSTATMVAARRAEHLPVAA